VLISSRFESLKIVIQSTTRAIERQQIPDQVEVTLLLSGGQEYTLSVPTQDLLLHQLFEVVMDWEGKRDRRLFQIPIHQGKAMLTFPCDRLVALITNPPLAIQQPIAVAPRPPASHLPGSHLPTSQNLLISNFVQLDQFLPPQQHQQLLQQVLRRKGDFVSTSTSTGDRSHRRSKVLYDLPNFTALITQQIQAVLPNVVAQLGLAPLRLGQVEAQITAHNDGNYYKVHNDNGSPDTASRELTYVYYFNREPKAFSGGELRLYDSRIENSFFVKAESFRTIEPRNNSIVFFLSRSMHEVLPVRCPSKSFADSRFTMNGWVRRAD
jgi:SM-20-related protein